MDNEMKPRDNQARAEQKNNSKPYHKNHKKKKHHPRPAGEQANRQPENGALVSESQHNGAPDSGASVPTKSNNNNKRRQKHKKGNRPYTPAPMSQDSPLIEEIQPENTPAAIELGSDAMAFYETAENEVAKSDEELVEIIGVRFKDGGKTYYFSPNGITAKKGQFVIVETARGLEFGKVAIANSKVAESEFVPPLRPVVRIATDMDVKHHDDNIVKQDEAAKICNEKILEHNLDMKLIDVQYTFDNTKLLFYFTSSGRVDFRELVKDLASIFKTRIELRQIGIRDEAKLIGGLGICGRPLCCSVFLTDFGQVSIKMAKEQNLSLNSSKISGACGRLMCCLRYEYDTYLQEGKNLPSVDSFVRTPDGTGTVTEVMPLAGKVKVRLDEKPDVQPKVYTKESITIIPKQK